MARVILAILHLYDAKNVDKRGKKHIKAIA